MVMYKYKKNLLQIATSFFNLNQNYYFLLRLDRIINNILAI